MTSIQNLNGLRVLVVEDAAWSSMMIENMLGSIGCDIIGIANTLFEALTKVSTLSYDAVLLDVNVASENTFLVAKLLTGKGVPFVFSRCYEDEPVPDAWCKVPVLQKPFQKHDLEMALYAALFAKLH